MVKARMRNGKHLNKTNPPAYLSKTELKHQLSLGDSVIDRMIAKKLLPKPMDFDGNQRWRWEDVETYIFQNNHIGIHEENTDTDEIMAGIDNVTRKDHNGTAQRRNTR